MFLTRREVLAQLAALTAMTILPRRARAFTAPDPLDGTIADYQAGLRRDAWSAAEITARALERCRTDGMTWRAIDALSATALTEARAADVRRRDGKLRGPLDGVPVFAKSIYDMNGLPTTGSSAEWARLFPDPLRRDALEVARLRAAGAIVLGKTAADDFAYRGDGTSSHTGQVRNPYDSTGARTPGGSSAGSAVAVAGGMAYAALGTDDGGSNRIPAQFSGVVGMKPSFGLVPRTGVIPTWPWLDTHGPLARSVADAALLLAAIAGADPSDSLARTGAWDGTPLAAFRDDALAGVRLGLVEANIPRAQMKAEALAVWDRAVGDLRAAGATVEPFDSPVTALNYRDAFAAAARERGDVAVNPRSPAPTANALYLYFAGRTDEPRAAVRRGYAAYQHFYDVLPNTFEECEPLLEQPMAEDAAGQSFAHSRADVVAALVQSMRKAGVAAMVWPTMPFNAPRVVDDWPDIETTLSYNNWLGLPEVSVPAGLGADGMPVLNLSLVGFPGDDARVLALAHAYERQSLRFEAPPRVGRRNAAAAAVLDPVSSPQWALDMARFAAIDAADPPPARPIVFTGSSSIRMWSSLAADFPGKPLLNRGFGGSQIRDAAWYADNVAIRYRPRQVVVYSGDNDIDAQRSPGQVAADFRAFVARIRRDLPEVPIAWISIKPSVARAAQLDAQREANARVKAAAAGMHDVDFIDVFTPMLGADGQPRPELFGDDGLHMNRKGYALWRDIVAPYLL